MSHPTSQTIRGTPPTPEENGEEEPKAIRPVLMGDKFERDPVRLDTFLYGEKYLAQPKLSAVQFEAVRHLETIYLPEDEEKLCKVLGWEPVRSIHFAALEWGKGSGKDHICCIVLARWVDRLLCLKHPQRYYGKAPQSFIHFLNIASSAGQASRAFFAAFRALVKSAECFQGQYTVVSGDRNKDRRGGEPGKYEIEFAKQITAVSGHSGSASQEGLNLLGAIADEISEFRTKAEAERVARQSSREPSNTAESVIRLMKTSGRTRFPYSFKNAFLSYPRFCVTPDARVLGADLEWKEAGKLAVGDEIVAFDEELKGSKFRTARVTYAGRAHKPAYRIVTDRGEVTASSDHPWVVRWNVSGSTSVRRAWKNTEDLRPGDTMSYFIAPWDQDRTWEAGYVAGAFDGEGTMFALPPHPGPGHAGAGIGLAQNPGKELLEFVEAWCESSGFATSRYRTRDCVTLQVLGGFPTVMRLLGTVRPKRLMAGDLTRLWEGRPLNHRGMLRATVLSVEPVGEVEVASISTSTATFITEGMFAHNSGDAIEQLIAKGQIDNKERGAESKWYVSGPAATWDVNPTVNDQAAFADDYREDQATSEAMYECRPGRATNRAFRDDVAIEASFARIIPPPLKVTYYWGSDADNPQEREPDAPPEMSGWQVHYDFDEVWPYRGCSYALHADMATTGDRAGMAMAHISEWKLGDWEGVHGKVHEQRPVVKVDFMAILEADSGLTPVAREVQIRWFRKLVWMLSARGFYIGKVTMDGFQSTDSLQIMTARGIEAEVLSCDRANSPVWKTLQDVMYDGRLLAYHDDLAIYEIQSLRRRAGGKVDHPDGGSKDLADSVAAAVYGALEAGGAGEGSVRERADTGDVDFFTQVPGKSVNLLPEGFTLDIEKIDLTPTEW